MGVMSRELCNIFGERERENHFVTNFSLKNVLDRLVTEL